MSSDELLRRGRSRAYALRQDNQGFDAKLIEDLCEALENATRATPRPSGSTVAVFDPR